MFLENKIVVLILHRVGVPSSDGLPANENMKTSKSTLEKFICDSRKSGFSFFSLDQVYSFIKNKTKIPSNGFVITFDDGYLDNYRYAYPLLKKLEVPFTIYITTDFIDSDISKTPWWYKLEKIILDSSSIQLPDSRTKIITSLHQKQEAFLKIRSYILEEKEDKSKYMDYINDIYIPPIINTCPFLTWNKILELSKDKLVTIGAHTISHPNLSRISSDNSLAEISESRKILEEKINLPVYHFAYPYGGINEVSYREITFTNKCGYRTASSTNFGFINNRVDLHCLPRAALTNNLEFSKLRMQMWKFFLKNNFLNIK